MQPQSNARLDNVGKSIFDKYYPRVTLFFSNFDPRQIVLEAESFKKLSLAFIQAAIEVGKVILRFIFLRIRLTV